MSFGCLGAWSVCKSLGLVIRLRRDGLVPRASSALRFSCSRFSLIRSMMICPWISACFAWTISFSCGEIFLCFGRPFCFRYPLRIQFFASSTARCPSVLCLFSACFIAWPCICRGSGAIPASFSRTGMGVALYAPVIFRRAVF